MRKFVCVASLCLVYMAGILSVSAKEKITFAYVLDPVYESMIYAVRAGKITSSEIDVEMTSISVPAIVQALSTKQYDVVNAAAVQVPEALARGIDMKILSVSVRYPADSIGANIWVKKDSPYKSIEDLKGKTIAISTFNSGGTTLIRVAISKKHKLDVKIEDGYFQWVEIPTGAQLTALATGKVDASSLLHSQAIKADDSGDFRAVMHGAQDFHDIYGAKPVTGINVAFTERLKAHPKAYVEFDRMMKESRDYAVSHIDEVSQAVAVSTGASPGLLKEWLSKLGEFPATIDEGDMTSIQYMWEAQKDLGLIKDVPDIKNVLWENAQRPGG